MAVSRGILKLWKELDSLPTPATPQSDGSVTGSSRALHWARMGRHGKELSKLYQVTGLPALKTTRCNPKFLKRHPQGPVLQDCDLSVPPSAITVTESIVLTALNAFPKGSSPGGFQLWAQHILDTVAGTTAPVAQDCLHQLTRLVNFLLSGAAHKYVAPWVCGAPITALHKKNGGVRPVAVCEII